MRANIIIAMPQYNADRFGILSFANFQESLENVDRLAARQVLDDFEGAALVKRRFTRRPGGSISVEYTYNTTGRRERQDNVLSGYYHGTYANGALTGTYTNGNGTLTGTNSNAIGYASIPTATSLTSSTIYANAYGTLTCG